MTRLREGLPPRARPTIPPAEAEVTGSSASPDSSAPAEAEVSGSSASPDSSAPSVTASASLSPEVPEAPGAARATLSPEAPGAPPSRDLRARRLALPLAGLQLVAYLVAGAIQPAPTNEAVAWEWLGVLLNLALVGAVAIAALTADRPATSVRASFGAGLVGLALVAGCPATGHHELAGWWYGQAALFTGSTAAAGAVWWRLRATRQGAS